MSPVLTNITPNIRSFPGFEKHQQVIQAIDKDTGLHAIIAIHSSHRGPALGGCRFWTYKTKEEAIIDALRLSHSMTLKAALAGLPLGGGKSVIIGDPKTDKSKELFYSFGEVLEALEGKYISGEDVGTSVHDIDYIAEKTLYVVGGHRGHGGDPSPMTAYGVFVGLRAAIKHKLRCDNMNGLTVAVQGLGNVGYNLCKLLHRDGAKLIVADINEQSVKKAERDFDAQAVSPDDILSCKADIVAPCALGGILNDTTIPQLNCAIVGGSANNQLLEEDHGDMLCKRGILYAPDYAINAGGLIAVSLELTLEGYDYEHAIHLTEQIESTLRDIFQHSDDKNTPTNLVAHERSCQLIKHEKVNAQKITTEFVG